MKMLLGIVCAMLVCAFADVAEAAKCKCDGCDCRASKHHRSKASRRARRCDVQTSTNNTAPNTGYNPYGGDGVRPLGGMASAAGATQTEWYWEKQCSRNGKCVMQLRQRAVVAPAPTPQAAKPSLTPAAGASASPKRFTVDEVYTMLKQEAFVHPAYDGVKAVADKEWTQSTTAKDLTSAYCDWVKMQGGDVELRDIDVEQLGIEEKVEAKPEKKEKRAETIKLNDVYRVARSSITRSTNWFREYNRRFAQPNKAVSIKVRSFHDIAIEKSVAISTFRDSR